jgi:hypothetical protein
MSHVIGTWTVSLCIDTDLLREATMANELSGRRCDVREWHDTNHRKDILGSVFHR